MMATIFKRHITKVKIGLVGMTLLGAGVLGGSIALSQPVSAISTGPPIVANAAGACANKASHGVGFFGLEPWYHFMSKELGTPKHGNTPRDACGVQCFNIFPQATANECGQTSSDIPAILLVVVDDLLRIAGYVAVAFIIISSFQYVASRGNSERTAQAQATMVSALTGLAVVLAAVGLVTFIGNKL